MLNCRILDSIFRLYLVEKLIEESDEMSEDIDDASLLEVDDTSEAVKIPLDSEGHFVAEGTATAEAEAEAKVLLSHANESLLFSLACLSWCWW